MLFCPSTVYVDVPPHQFASAFYIQLLNPKIDRRTDVCSRRHGNPPIRVSVQEAVKSAARRWRSKGNVNVVRPAGRDRPRLKPCRAMVNRETYFANCHLCHVLGEQRHACKRPKMECLPPLPPHLRSSNDVDQIEDWDILLEPAPH